MKIRSKKSKAIKVDPEFADYLKKYQKKLEDKGISMSIAAITKFYILPMKIENTKVMLFKKKRRKDRIKMELDFRL